MVVESGVESCGTLSSVASGRAHESETASCPQGRAEGVAHAIPLSGAVWERHRRRGDGRGFRLAGDVLVRNLTARQRESMCGESHREFGSLLCMRGTLTLKSRSVVPSLLNVILLSMMKGTLPQKDPDND